MLHISGKDSKKFHMKFHVLMPSDLFSRNEKETKRRASSSPYRALEVPKINLENQTEIAFSPPNQKQFSKQIRK